VEPGKGRSGPKPRYIDWERVKFLAERHCTTREIAADVGITPQGLGMRKEFYPIYHAAWLKGNISLRQAQFALAEAGNVTMQIWLGKNNLGQTDRLVVDSTLHGPDGGPVQIQEADLTKLSDEKLRQLRDLLAEVKAIPATSGPTIDVTPKSGLMKRIVKRGSGRGNGKGNGSGR
jgi:hypothetical protein